MHARTSAFEEAIAELQDEFDHWQAEIGRGERGEDEGCDIGTFKVRCNDTGLEYDLDLVGGKVTVLAP